MKFHGDINLNDNEMQQMVMQLETNFPSSPIVGRMVYKGSRLYICVEINNGLPTWVPLTNEINTHTHVQTPSATSWNIEHNLQTNTPLVQVYEAVTGSQVIPDEITVIDSNNVTVSFGASVEGRATVMHGNITGAAKPTIAYEHYQTSSSTTWVITHGLGYEPIVRVFVGNQEVQPDSIVHDSLNQVTITFSSAQTGFARLI
jgi:hypothetical protein